MNHKFTAEPLQTMFGQRLLYVREARGMTRDALAEAAGVSEYTVRNYENRGHMPMLVPAVNMARALGVSLDWLCGLGPNKRVPLEGDIDWVKEEST